MLVGCFKNEHVKSLSESLSELESCKYVGVYAESIRNDLESKDYVHASFMGEQLLMKTLASNDMECLETVKNIVHQTKYLLSESQSDSGVQ